VSGGDAKQENKQPTSRRQINITATPVGPTRKSTLAPFARLLLAAGNDGRAFEVIVVAVQLVVIFAVVQVVIFVKVIKLASTGPLLELYAQAQKMGIARFIIVVVKLR
jgi:hypothetical protein